MPGFVAQVIRRNQQLRHGMMILAEKLVVDVHQLALAHGSSRLLGGNIPRPGSQTQLAHPHADGTGGHQNQLMARVADVAHGLA